MPSYDFSCTACGSFLPNVRLRPDDPRTSEGVPCPDCGAVARQDYRHKLSTFQACVPAFYHVTASDTEPPGLRGADKSDPIRKQFKDETREPQRVTSNRVFIRTSKA